jgi:hypothetical protein
MRKNADKHCSHYGESDGGQALLLHPMLEIDQPKTMDASPREPNHP